MWLVSYSTVAQDKFPNMPSSLADLLLDIFSRSIVGIITKMQEYCILLKSVRKPQSPHCTGQCFITDTQRFSSAHLIKWHLMAPKSAHPHLTWLWVHTFPLLQRAFLKNLELSWLEHGATNTKDVDLIPVWAICWREWSLWLLPTQNFLWFHEKHTSQKVK